MILLDTNVLSALMRTTPEPIVVRWFDLQPRQSIWITTITVMEIRAGIQSMSPGRKQDILISGFEMFLREKIQGRIAPFDISAAEQAAQLIADRRRRGSPVEHRDTMIAGIAVATRATLATRNVAHFQDLSVPVVNPWQ